MPLCGWVGHCSHGATANSAADKPACMAPSRFANSEPYRSLFVTSTRLCKLCEFEIVDVQSHTALFEDIPS